MTHQKETENTHGKPKFKIVTLKDLGSNLPLGVKEGGVYHKSIGPKRWRMAEERELGELRDNNRDNSVAQFVSMVIATMFNKFGPYDFSQMKFEDKILRISQMFVGDVFYAYMYLRTVSLGNELGLEIKCPKCRHEFPFRADLTSLEVTTCPSAEEASFVYDLVVPFEIRGKKVTKFRFGPSRWASLESMKGIGTMNSGAAKSGIIIGAIQNIIHDDGEEEQLALGPNEIDEMSKVDIEAITKTLDVNALGPEMVVEDKCPKCKGNFRMAIDWSYEGFFGTSSQ